MEHTVGESRSANLHFQNGDRCGGSSSVVLEHLLVFILQTNVPNTAQHRVKGSQSWPTWDLTKRSGSQSIVPG